MRKIGGEDYFTTDEAADYLGLQPETLRKYRHTGGGPRYVKPGGHRNTEVHYPQSELDAWFRGERRDGGGPVGRTG